MSSTATVKSETLFSRATLLVIAFLCCFATLVATWLIRDRQWTPTLPLPAVLITLLVVLPVGEFIRQRFRLSLGSLLVLVSVAAVLLGLFGTRWNRARRQRRAVMSIYSIMDEVTDAQMVAAENSGFPMQPPVTDVTYNKPSSIGGDFINTPEGWVIPGWMVQLLGDDFFFQVSDASIQLAELTAPHSLENVELSFFDHLHFYSCKFGPNAFAKLLSHTDVKELHFTSCGLTDSQLAELAKLPALESLLIVNSPTNSNPNKITAEGIKEIAKIETLRYLILQNAGIGPGELEPLRRLKNIELLGVSHNPLLTNDDAKIVLAWPQLKGARFSGTKVNEDSLLMFRSIKSLEWVSINPSSPEVEKRLSQDENSQRPQVRFR